MARKQGSPRSGVVALLTDFGVADGYVAAMKGVILGLNPRASLVDVTHDIAPQGVRDGAFVLHTVHPYFPQGTVQLAVVDPGVGTERAAVILDTGRDIFVAPDNGLLSFVLAEAATGRRGDGERVKLPEGWRAVQIAEPRFWLPNPSTTFHGRDIFAPVAAHLSLGEPLESFGPALTTLKAFPVPVPNRLEGERVAGEVLHVDRFGNLITNLRREDLPEGELVTEIGGHRIQGLRRSYAGGPGLVALIGSSGYLEIAQPDGSAREAIGKEAGTPVLVFPQP